MIFFKVDANNKIGGGHLHRCIVLALECQSQGEEVAFIFSETPEKEINRVKSLSIPVFKISPESSLDINSYKNILTPKSLILFDTDNPEFYAGELINQLENANIKTACYTITDEYPISTDLLINTNIASQTHSYKILPKTIKLLGPKYMIFGQSFRRKIIQPKTTVKSNTLLLFFGNADKESLTLHFLKILAKVDFPFNKINVIVGALNNDASLIKKEILKLNKPGIKYLFNISNIQTIYEETDVAITAAGMSMWEMALYNIPQLVVASSVREMSYCPYLKKLNFVHLLGNYGNIKEITSDYMLQILESNQLQKLNLDGFRTSIDPNGIGKMVHEFKQLLNN